MQIKSKFVCCKIKVWHFIWYLNYVGLEQNENAILDITK